MRKHKFSVFYKNGKRATVYGGTVYQAIIQATATANASGDDARIEKMYDETDKVWYNRISLRIDYEEVLVEALT